MLSQRSISLGCLAVSSGITIGLILLAMATFLDMDDLGRWAIAVIALACTLSIHRSIDARDARLRQAFEAGRDYGRNDLSAVR